MLAKVNKIVEEKIRPGLQMDGGDIEIIDVENGIVKVRLHGACHGCPSASATLFGGVERILKAEIPEIKGVVPVM
jgi:Fe-S cluster biogenesis protein NfuA